MKQELFFHDEIMLLALRDEEGTMAAGMEYAFALGGAFVAELLLQGRIRIRDSGKKPWVEAVDASPLGNSLLDECLQRIRTAKRRSAIGDWVSRFARIKRLKHRVAESLCQRGILRSAEDKVLLIFSRKTYPTLDPGPERRVVARLRRAIFTDSTGIAPRTVVLVSLAHGADLLRIVFDKKELKTRKARIREIVEGERMGKAAKEAVDAARAAILAAATAAITTSTVASQ